MNPANLSLGCADEYEVIITAPDLETYAAGIKVSNISYTPGVLDEVSEASVIVPDVFGGLRCNIELGSTIQPWRYGLRIERNGELAWSGPIIDIERPVVEGVGADYVEIFAQDAMAWGMKRTTPNFLDYTDTDAGTVFKGVLDAGMAPHNPAALDCPTFGTGYTMTREVVPLDFEYTYDILSELADSAVDYFVRNNELCVYDAVDFGWYALRDGVKRRIAPTPDPYGRYFFGLFTTEAFATRPGYRISGMEQGNNVYVPGADSGEAGFRRYWNAADIDPLDGLLTHVDVSALYRPSSNGPITDDAVFQQRADSVLALRRTAPITISGGTLSQEAPIRFQDLIPGSLWAIDLGESGLASLLTIQRLKRVDVNVTFSDSGVTETISPTLIPVGSDESVIG